MMKINDRIKSIIIRLLGGIQREAFAKSIKINYLLEAKLIKFIADSNKRLNQEIMIKRKLTKLLSVNTEFNTMVKGYDSKHKLNTRLYVGTPILTKKYGIMNPKIKVTDYITVIQSMKDWCKDKGLMFTKEPTPENVSRHAWNVYSNFTKLITYVTDKDLYGVDEFWQASSLQFYIKNKGKWVADCENFANLCLGLIFASGVPRGLCRVTCGMTKLGGHASLTCWDWRTKKFEQWETTSRYARKITEKDNININEVWFSFDNKYSWSNNKGNQVNLGGRK